MEIFSLLYLIFTPLVVAMLIAYPKFPNNPVVIRRFAKSFAGAHLIYALLFLLDFDYTSYTAAFPCELTIFKQSWLQTLGIKATFAVDGLSLIFVILTSFITLLALFASRNKITYSHKLYYSLFFVAQTSILGLLCAQDMFVFYFFLELSLIPMYFLISHWTANEDEKMSRKFLGYNILGGFLILTPMLFLYFYNFAMTGTLSAGIETLNLGNFSYPEWFQITIFSLFLLGFLMRIGIVPFHNWFIECMETAKIPVSMFLLSCFAPTGFYGILRFNIGEFSQVYNYTNTFIFALALIAIIYTAFLLTTEKNLKRIVGYFAVLQNSIILLGGSFFNSLTYAGVVLLVISSSIILCGYLVMAQVLERREKTYLIPYSNCLAKYMPKFRIFAYIIFFASLITPFLFGFYSVMLVLFGVGLSNIDLNMPLQILLIVAALMFFVVYIYLISVFHQMLFSTSQKVNNKVHDITISEITMLSFITVALLFFGIYPMALINIINTTALFVINIFRI